MLLSHTSSLNTNGQEQYYWFNFSGDPPFDFFPEPYLSEFLLPGGEYYDSSVWSTRYRPGEYAMYANVGFDVISYLVEIISGESFLEYCDTHIFSPLDMKNTVFNFSLLDVNQVAIPYQRVIGRYYTIDELGMPDKYWRGRFYPAGGLYSNVRDLSHFLIAHMNSGIYNGTRILEKETVDLMHKIQPGNNLNYGLGWYHKNIRGISASGHAGDLLGIDTWMLINLTEDIGVICLANGNPAYGVFPIMGQFAVRSILYLLFTKEGFGQGEIASSNRAQSTPYFPSPLIAPRLLLECS
jgi:CubicO group peptidase (beta-lactamase class C family)